MILLLEIEKKESKTLILFKSYSSRLTRVFSFNTIRAGRAAGAVEEHYCTNCSNLEMLPKYLTKNDVKFKSRYLENKKR